MEEIARLDHVYQYNELMGIETLHPLVSVIDMSKCPRMRHSRRLYGFYCIFLKDVKCGDLRYGRNYYDYQEGTLVFTAPGQVVGVDRERGTFTAFFGKNGTRTLTMQILKGDTVRKV